MLTRVGVARVGASLGEASALASSVDVPAGGTTLGGDVTATGSLAATTVGKGAPVHAGPFAYQNVSAGAGPIKLYYGELIQQTGMPQPHAGEVSRVGWALSTPLTGGSLTLRLTVGGVATGDVITVVPASGVAGVVTLSAPVPYAAGALLGATWQADAAMTPSGTPDLSVDLHGKRTA